MRFRNWIQFGLAVCGVMMTMIALGSAQSTPSKYIFSAGGGPGVGLADAGTYAGTTYQFNGGAGLNFNRLFGGDVEYMYYNLDFKPSVTGPQSLPGQSGWMQSISVDGIFNVPYHPGKLGIYGIFGGGFYDRNVSISPSQQLQGGTLCRQAWRWWDLPCDTAHQIPPNSGTITMSSNSKVAGGFNFGVGLTYRLNHLHNAKLFGEVRYHRAYTSDGQTIVMPITFGLRW